ncbi:metallophosphoesterase [Actinoplanes xinjiangensis]|uniref:metallophosphoesterase n=1 Tax=Actinoplanes xinjiangensis TaxID=512350 RepID=UPI000D6BB9BD
MLVFFAVVLLGIGLIHYYLWKRLVRDPLRPGWGRRAGTIVAVVLCALVPLTLIGVRAGYFTWLSWPGYLWVAVMFYLLVTLLVLEIPRLLLMRLWAGSGRTTGKSPIETSGEPALIGTAGAAGGAGAGATTATEAAAATPTAAETPSRSGTETSPQVVTDTPSRSGTETSPRVVTDTPPWAGTETPPRVGTDTPPRAGADTPASTGSVAGDPSPTERQGIERRLLLARGTAIFAGLTAAGITGYGVKTATSAPQIDRVQLPMAKLPRAMDGTRLAVVSDIHIGPLTGVNHAQRIVQVINSVNADLVCIVGDLVDGSVAELGRFAAPLGGIESRHGAFFVTGNHEYYSGAEEWINEVSRLGIRPLRNERVAINGLDLAGVNDLSGEEQGDAPDFARALGDRDTARPVVLMAHQPVAAVEAAPYGVDLQVSGHTHGGQMAPFNLLVKLQQPVVSGFGEVDGVPVYVTNGAGFWGPPVRVGAPPQVTVIELRVA